MLVSFFESFKYVGHFVPIAVLRMILGFKIFSKAVEHYQGDFLKQPILAAMINEWLPQSSAPAWYIYYMDNFVVSNWQIFSYTITYIEFLIGVSFILGFFIRPVSIIGLLLSLNFLWISEPNISAFYGVLIILFIVLGWLGAGRCLGVDYFFYKRKRGIWW